MDLHSILSDAQTYLEQIDRIHQRHERSAKLYTLQQDGVTLASMIHDRKRLARLLAKSVGKGRYEFQPARVREVTINRKQRQIYLFCLTDLILQSAQASILTELMRPLLTDHVYSFRRGTSWHRAITNWAGYLRKHRAQHPDPRTRGVFVLRRDVRKYSESIPLDESSPLWPMLESLLEPHWGARRRRLQHWNLLRQAIQPRCLTDDNREVAARGIPTGAAIAPPLLNLYLTSLDDRLAAVHGAFYARYGDDFLFAHPDHEVVRQADRHIDEILAALSLVANRDKNCSVFFNGAGRRSPLWPEAEPASSVSFLGCNVQFDATISLTRTKTRELLRDLSERINRTRSIVGAGCQDDLGRAICGAVNASLDPQAPLCHKSAQPLRKIVTDRGQLKQLDYQVARLVQRAVTGSANVRAFRQVPLRTLRRDWQLVSLYHERNVSGRARGVRSCAP